MPIKVKPLPARFKKLEESDIMNINGKNKEVTLVTKQETRSVIKELLEGQCDALLKKASAKVITDFDKIIEENVTPTYNTKFEELKRDIAAYIDFRIDVLAKNITESLLTRKFNEEVERRVEKMVEEKLRIERLKGNF